MEYKDYYKILGVSKQASQDEIKRAYRKLARRYHPDVSKEADAEVRFKELGEAYEVLRDPKKRQAYDQLGSGWHPGEDFRPPPGWERQFDFDLNEADLGNGQFSDFFESLFGRRPGGRGRGVRMAGSDQRASIRISLEEAVRGGSRTLTLQMPALDAQGHTVLQTRQLKVNIPRGVTKGQRIRLAGQGQPGIGGGPSGDLYLEVDFEPHRLFRAEGRDIYMNLKLAPWEAALGATITVPTLGGRVDLKVPPGSQTGQQLRLKGRGLPGSPPGDQYVVLQVVTPRADTPQARALYERMQREMPFNPRLELEEAP